MVVVSTIAGRNAAAGVLSGAGMATLLSFILTDAEISAVSHYFDSDLFSIREKVALEYAEAISKTPVKVSDEMFARLKNYFDEKFWR